MNKIFYTISVFALLVALYSCDEADPSLKYEKMTLPIGEVTMSSSLTEKQREAITSLLNSMVKVEDCQFYMGAQGRTSTRYNYSSAYSAYSDSLKLTEFTDVDGKISYIKNSTFVDYVHLLDKRSYRHTLSNGTVQVDTIRFTQVYKMPTATGVDNGNLWVGPVTEMCVPESFYIGAFEITQSQWMAVMGQWPTGRRCVDVTSGQDSAWYVCVGCGDDYPAYNVWYDDAVKFCEKLNQLCNMPNGLRFRLPTEVEWECAARGGRYSRGYRYPGSDDYTEVAWCSSNALSQEIWQKNYGMHKGGELAPNELGLYDMAGNVSEWVENTYYRYSYRDSIANASFNAKHLPKHAAGGYVGDTLITRGGSWHQSYAYPFEICSRQEYTGGTVDPARLQSMIMHCGFRIVLAK